MFDRYLVEVNDRAAGILIRNGAAYAFHSVGKPFAAMEGMTFPDAPAATRAARRLARDPAAAPDAARARRTLRA